MSRRSYAILFASLLAVAGQAQAVNPNDSTDSTPVGPMVGAYAPAAVDSPLVAQAKAFVQDRFPSLSLQTVNVAYTQVVRGFNIKLIGTGLDEGRQETWKFVVYRDLDGTMSLSIAERL